MQNLYFETAASLRECDVANKALLNSNCRRSSRHKPHPCGGRSATFQFAFVQKGGGADYGCLRRRAGLRALSHLAAKRRNCFPCLSRVCTSVVPRDKASNALGCIEGRFLARGSTRLSPRHRPGSRCAVMACHCWRPSGREGIRCIAMGCFDIAEDQVISSVEAAVVKGNPKDLEPRGISLATVQDVGLTAFSSCLLSPDFVAKVRNRRATILPPEVEERRDR